MDEYDYIFKIFFPSFFIGLFGLMFGHLFASLSGIELVFIPIWVSILIAIIVSELLFFTNDETPSEGESIFRFTASKKVWFLFLGGSITFGINGAWLLIQASLLYIGIILQGFGWLTVLALAFLLLVRINTIKFTQNIKPIWRRKK